MKLLLLFAVVLSVVTVSLCNCPSDWRQFNQKCYFFSTTGSLPQLSWHEAQTKCETMRGNLAVIETAEENTFLYNNQRESTDYYVGLHDLNAENEWQWVDGQMLEDDGFIMWAEGQPDNWQSAIGFQEDCVVINYPYGGVWNDVACSMRFHYICEREFNLQPYPNCQESEGWEEYNERCYKFVNNEVPWIAAETDCVDLGGHLVAISTEQEQLFISGKVNEWNKHTWIGLSNVNNKDHLLFWSNEVDTYPGYNNWGSGQPDIPDPTAPACTGVDPSVATNSPWGIERCGNSHAYICETGITHSCAPGWYLYKGNCYFQASTEQLWKNWAEAKDYCENMGASLLKIDSWEKQEYINTRLPDIADGGSINVWIGISDSVSDNVFVWTDGTSAVSNPSFYYWQDKQPINRPNAWDCGQIFTGSSWGGWEVDDCYLQQAFMCEILPGVAVKPSEPVGTGNTGCDPGWQYFQDHCYYFEYVKEYYWASAEDECVRYGGHLVSILTGEENSFVTGHATGATWIGAHDAVSDGRWTWSDNSPWGPFTNWAPGEPVGGSANDCAQLWAGQNYQWDDAYCDNKKNFVCKTVVHDCVEPLGMENGRIVDDQITASSMWDSNHAPYLARLNNYKSGNVIGAWCPAMDGDIFAPPGNHWIQIHLVPQRQVTAITTQGRPADWNQYVKTYTIRYSTDGSNFIDVGKTFTANNDVHTPVTNRLPSPVVASYIRLYPMSWQESPTLRMEILGCKVDGSDLATPSPSTECTNISPHERLDCGYPGIGGERCLNKGCCWDNTVSGVNWCFYPEGDYDPRCGKDWQFDPSGQFLCYYFNDYKRRTWSQAREYCLSMGGDLLSIHSQTEQAYVTSHLSYYVLSNALWMGANSLDGEFGWQNSDRSAFNFVNWRDGEPNDSDEQCVEMYTSDGKWNDIGCHHETGFACKKFADIAPPSTDPDGSIKLDICEGERGTLACTGNTVITVHHAVYGRTNDFTCGEGNLVPEGGCIATNTLDVVSEMCNNRDVCVLDALNDIYGDPCNGVYKYLNVIYSCESKDCYRQLGVENGTVTDERITASSYIDGSHKPTDGRLNGGSSWASNEAVGAWIQVTFPSNLRVTGIIIQGANDAERYVTKFKVSIANDNTFAAWNEYQDYDGNVVNFDGNTDSTTAKRVVLSEHVYTPGIRIYPLEWQGDMIGMRFELTGCHPLQELGCSELGDIVVAIDEGETIQAECPGLCPALVSDVAIYGTGIYAGNSQICNAAIHAGVIIDRFGGPVTLVRKPGQSSYRGSVRNTLVSDDFDYYAVAFAFTNNEKNCEAGWVPFQSHCYWMPEYGLTWGESEATCVQKGGNLVSIFNQVEQDFLTQMIHLHQYQRIWLGLSELQTMNTYEWSDNEVVTYTNWMPGEPNNHEGALEKCVHMYRDTTDRTIAGKWNDVDCQEEAGLICKKFKQYYTEDEAAHPTPPPGCKEGWIGYDYMCYLFDRNLVVEEEAENFCKEKGGVTVHVYNRYIQSFLHTVVGSEDLRWWIGIHADVTEDGGVSWHWESGDPVSYDNWAPGNPTIGNGECAVIYGGIYGYGYWYSTRCSKEAYTICEAPREGYTKPPPTTPPPKDGCYHDWVSPSKDSGYCYKVYSPEAAGDYDHKQSWNNAYHQCTSLKADLVSIHSKEEEVYLIQEISKLGMVTEYVWIGLNNKGGGDWMWSDTSPVQYLNWKLGSPSNNIENNCVSMKYDSMTNTGFWQNTDCQQKLDWICKIKKGIPVVEPTEPPIGTPDPSCGNPNDGDWIRFDEMCYLFNNGTTYDVYSAERKCNDNGGYLTSIHSTREQSFINNVIKSLSVDRFWSGLREIGGINGEYMWSDGTPLDFVYWNEGEPNNGAGMEQCVTLLKKNGRWNDANCGMKFAGFVCKKYPNGVPVSPAPTQPAEGGCPSGWYMYGNDCYKIFGDFDNCDPQITNNTDCAADFGTAQLLCVAQDGNLVTIHNKYENAFVAAQSYQAINNLWIGLSSYTWNSQPFHWASGDELTYTNWNNGEPNSVDGSEHCVETYRTEAVVGRWNDVNCDNKVPYICSKRRSPAIAVGQEINSNANCPSGWVEYDAVNENSICYYLQTEMKTFDEAQKSCQNMGASLVSIHSNYEQAFLTSYVKDQTVWIGMMLNTETSEWVWMDGWPVWVTNWGEYEPGSDPSKVCAINKDSVLGSEWVTASCSEPQMSVCKQSSESIPTTPGYVEGYCEDSSWQQLGGYCYFAFVAEGSEENPGVTWSDAETMCNQYNGHLASFTHRSELEWALDWYNYTESLWIGLNNNGQGGWAWTDYRAVSFVNWGTGEPNNYGEDGEECVEMMPDGKWNDLYCLDLKGYMCRIPKIVGTDDDGNVIHFTTTTTPEQLGSSDAGVIAGAVIGGIVAIIIIAGIAVYCTRNSSSVSKLPEDAANLPKGIVNNIYSVAGPNNSSSNEKEKPGLEVTFDTEKGANFQDSSNA